MKYHVIDTKNPFEFEKEVHREEVQRLNTEIRRLKLKCGEPFTADEMLRGYGNPPDMYVPSSHVERRARSAERSQSAT